MSSRSRSGRNRLPRRAAAYAITTGGGLLIAVGVALTFGPGWALIAAGALALAGGLLLVDVDEDRRRGR